MAEDRLLAGARRGPVALDTVRGAAVLVLGGPHRDHLTGLLEAVVPPLRRRGLRVAVVGGHGEDEHHDLAAALPELLARHDLVLVERCRDVPLPTVGLAADEAALPPPEVGTPVAVLPPGADRQQCLLATLERWLAETWARRRVLGGVLVGGGARRMGRPKHLLRFRGRTLVEVAWAALGPHVEEVVLLGRGAAPPALAAAPRLDDAGDARGPLAGMLAAMRWGKDAAWVFAACDLPLVSAEAVAWLVARRRPGCWAVLPRVSERGVEPLLALYEPQARPLLEAVAAGGRAEPRLIGSDPAVVSPLAPSHLAAAWRNVNTPQDFVALGGVIGGAEDRG